MDTIICIDGWSHAPRATVDDAGSDQLLPAQLDLSGHFGTDGGPERRLMLAVLEHAVHDLRLRTVDRRSMRRFEDAADWFAADVLDHPFSFSSICLALGFDPDYLRTQLRRTFGAAAVRRRPVVRGRRIRRRRGALVPVPQAESPVHH